jgi:hypothetical protein
MAAPRRPHPPASGRCRSFAVRRLGWVTTPSPFRGVMIIAYAEYISYKMTPVSEKGYRACSNTGTDRGRGLPGFLPPAWTSLVDSIQLLVHLWQQKASLSRLMVATQQVGEKMTWGLFNKEGLTWVWLAESGGYDLCQKLLWLILSYKLFSLKCNIEPTTESTVTVWPKEQLTNHPNIPTIQNPSYSNHVRIHAADNREPGCYDSSTLCRGCTHSLWVVIILRS